MKIICDNCAAKYSIADEKVAGKVFKIRCKKCSNVLEVRGDEFNDENDATQVYDYGKEAVWYVVIDGAQQGPMTPMQLGVLFTKGEITRDNYVWREGFEDWKPASSISELKSFVGPDGPHRGDPTAELDLSEERHRAAAEGNGAVADASGEHAASAPDASIDLFAAAAAEPKAAAGGDPNPQRLTGQRNENSVLFSLGNLQQLASTSDAPAPAASSGSQSGAGGSLGGSGSGSGSSGGLLGAAALGSAPKPSGGLAAGEGSGLIDIRALAQASSSIASEPAPVAPQTDLLAQVKSSFRSPSLGGSILQPAFDDSYKRQRWMMIGLVAAVVLAVGMAAALFIMIKKPEPKIVVGAPSDVPAQVRTEPAKAPAPTPAPVAAVAAPEPTEAEEPEAEEPEEPAEAAPAPAPTVASARPSSRKRRSSRSSTRTRSSSSSSSPTAAAPTKSSSKSSSLEDLMDQVVGGGDSKSGSTRSSSSSSSRSTSNLSNSPSRSEVMTALSGVSGAVRSCKQGDSGTATVSVTFAGSTGRVRSAKIASGPFKGTAVGSCIEKAVKRARLSKFKQSSFNVKFPYRL